MRLTFRKKALLFVLPILGLVSIVYTYEAIRTEEGITRTEIIKRAEAITRLATKTGELPILSGIPELLNNTVSSLRDNSEVASVTFYDNKMKLLVHDGPPISGQLPGLSPETPISMSDDRNMFVFFAPIFTIRAAEDVDIFQEARQSRRIREHIGWVRLGFSKAAMNEAVGKVVLRGFMLAIIFTVGSSIAVFFLITIATKPLMVLFNATKKLEKGEYPEIKEIGSTDEIGLLASAFNRMSLSIKERELRLKESENRIRELFERVEHAIFSLDKDGNIMEANSKFHDLFGNVGMLSDILSAEETVSNYFREAPLRSTFHCEEKARGKDDAELTVMISLYPKADQGDTIRGFDGYIVDITEKKRLEERLIRSQKMEAIGTLAGGIAHDFNNLLQAILGYSEMMLYETKEGDRFHNPVKVIHDAAKRGAHLTKTILSVSRKEKMEIKTIAINQIVEGSLELLERSIPKNIEIIVNLDRTIPIMMADPSHVEQVILNLAVNARDAMPDGGQLTIETAVEETDVYSFSKLRGRQRYVKLAVSDTGTGMDKETQGRIFEPFFTTKEVGKGTGLGLYTVHSIVDNHGGYINLYSEPGKGTRFTVYFPLGKRKGVEKPRENKDLRGSEKILVIDDDESVRITYRDMLSPLGYSLVLADSANEGIEIFRRMKNEISLVLLDIIMPKTSGSGVFQALRSIHPEAKILLCSGCSQDGNAEIDKLLKAGGNGFIQKPFTRQDIALAIRKVLQGPQ
jgi:two-component system cell cycle sensor histidine kinase/response regulator CckA